jgi:hypothetical protein
MQSGSAPNPIAPHEEFAMGWQPYPLQRVYVDG